MKLQPYAQAATPTRRRRHRRTIEIAAPQAAKQFGVIETDKDWRSSASRKSLPSRRNRRITRGIAMLRWEFISSIRNLLIPILLADSEIPSPPMTSARTFFRASFRSIRVFAYNFVDENAKDALYWRDVGTSTPIRSEHGSRQRLARLQTFTILPGRFRTWQHQYPPAKFVFADPERMGVALDSIVAGGSVISGGRVQKSVLGNNVRVNSYSEVSDSIIYNHVNVGRYSRIRRAIIDRHVSLPERTEIGYDIEADRRRFPRQRFGIVIVVRQESLIEEPESA